MVFKLKKINPIARLIAYTRRESKSYHPRKGKVLTIGRTKIKVLTFLHDYSTSNYHLPNCHKLWHILERSITMPLDAQINELFNLEGTELDFKVKYEDTKFAGKRYVRNSVTGDY